MEQVKPHLYIVYHILSGPVFHVNLGYEVQIQVFHPCDVLFVLINGMKDQFMYSKCSNG